MLTNGSVAADTSSQQQSGVTVTPILEQLDLNKNKTSASFVSTVTNNTAVLVTVNLSIRNFSSLNQNGGLNFSSQPMYFQSHGLAKNLLPAHNQLVLGPGQSVQDKINIISANKLSPGGHYAAILYKINAPNQTSLNSVSVNEAIASLVFVSTGGSGYQSLSLSRPSIASTTTSYPSDLDLVFKNNGNVQSVLRGYVQVYNSKNILLSQAQMDTSSNLILPGSERLFMVQLTSLKNHNFFPSHYHLKIYYGFDGQKNLTSFSKSFYVFSWVFVLTVLIGILIIIGLIYVFVKFLQLMAKRRGMRPVLLPATEVRGTVTSVTMMRRIPIQYLYRSERIKPQVSKKPKHKK
jgi:hypothetical protein